ncbi:ABC transporter substrate-binding protein [Alkalihalobacillus sp. TS-13]|uniref:ABC transporter substrate-binding protein n=1 Tax=Alkalihalobacillus sp. TS-13 TaxID=2842455 RepID=UPI001C885EFF|nr:ABC transporter substrate-binding protein [Alkalihalobacillus sp. TS-13]
MNRKTVVFSFTLILMLILSGCTTVGNQSENGKSAADKKEDRELIIGIPNDIKSFDIHNHNQVLTESVHINMFNYLFKRQTDTKVETELVDTYKLIDDVTWEFKLKEGITFHNGDPLTADDVEFTIERVAKDETLAEHSNMEVVKDVKVVNETTFQIITDNPQPTLINLLSRIGSGILPKNYIEENGWDHFLNKPVGSGPFKFVDWRRDNQIVFEPYDKYYEGKNEEWDKLVFRVIPETSTRINELLTGGVDIITEVTPNDIARINENEGTKAVSTPSQRVAILALQHREDYPTSDPKVREAIELAINNEVLVEQILKGEAVPVRTRVTPGNFGADPSLYDSYLYDVERSKELLAEAGYGDGLELSLSIPTGYYLKGDEISQAIKAMLSEVGITLNIEFSEYSRYIELRNSGEFGDMYFGAYGNSLFDASIALDMFASENGEKRIGYSNQEVKELFNSALTNMDTEEREKQYQKIQQIVAEERPFIYLYLQNEAYGIREGIDFKPRVDSMLYTPDITRN